MKKEIDRRIVFALVFLALFIPLKSGLSIHPARMASAEKFFKIVDELKINPGEIAMVALDMGPNTTAENRPQVEVAVEHLMRKRIPLAMISLYSQAEPFLNTVPEKVAARLMLEQPGERWEYGRDWVNLGFRPNGMLFLQALSKSEDIVGYLEKDAKGNSLKDLPAIKSVKKLSQIKLLAQFTGLLGMFDAYIQFFQNAEYRPVFVHGCTSITIPEAFIYMDSGQLSGLFEGLAGAAWYSVLLKERYPQRAPDAALRINTGLGVAHLVIIGLIILGNLGMLWGRRRRVVA